MWILVSDSIYKTGQPYIKYNVRPSVPPRLGLAPCEHHPGELVDLVKDSGREQEACCDANAVNSTSYNKSNKFCYNNCTPPSSNTTSFLVITDKGEEEEEEEGADESAGDGLELGRGEPAPVHLQQRQRHREQQQRQQHGPPRARHLDRLRSEI